MLQTLVCLNGQIFVNYTIICSNDTNNNWTVNDANGYAVSESFYEEFEKVILEI